MHTDRSPIGHSYKTNQYGLSIDNIVGSNIARLIVCDPDDSSRPLWFNSFVNRFP